MELTEALKRYQEALQDLVNQKYEVLRALQRLSEQCDRLRLPGQRETEAEKNAKAVIAKVLGQ